ncbi:hypothetical protein OG21DRAFT_1490468 [Imleria badia]|nr:hypothetical protein OG21DRAFT_1490468 [Imleria badia]
MVSDVKATAGAIFGKYMKFAPVLFSDPKNLNLTMFLKSATLVKILKVALFGKLSLSQSYAPGPKTKGKIWELRHTTPGMIAAVAVVCVFILSGDKELLVKGGESGDKSGIPYLQYHNFYHQHLLSNTPCTRDVFRFFNDSLFPDNSSEHASSFTGQAAQPNDWEEEFKHVMLKGSPALAVAAPTSGAAFQAPPQAGLNSISAATQDLSLNNVGPAPVPIAAAPASIPAVPAPIPIAPIPASIPAIPGSAAIPGSTPVPGVVLAGMPAPISAPIPAVVPVPAPAPFVILVPIPDDNELGAAEADPPQMKSKSKSKSKRSKMNTMAEGVVVVEDNAKCKTQSKKSAAK